VNPCEAMAATVLLMMVWVSRTKGSKKPQWIAPPKAKRMSLEDHIANISDCISIRNQLDLKKTLNHGNEEVVEVV
jgi:hypothetical protein